MASFTYLTLIITQITTLQSLSCTTETSTECNIDCHQNELCWNQQLTCNTELDCHIGCNGFENRRRLKHKIQKHTHRNLLSTNQCMGNNGCCGSTIRCPSNKDCSIDCSEGCNDIIIHAEDSNHLYISNCNSKQQENRYYCTNMTVFCPQNIHRATLYPICTIDGHIIQSTNIYTKQGFNDLQLTNSKSIIDTQVYCGNNIEYNCEINEDGNGCIDNNICNNLILTPNPTISPTVKSHISTNNKLTFYPTFKPTITAINEKKISTNNTSVNGDLYFNEEQQPILTVYGMDIKIVILSIVCFLLLMFCMLFFTLWMTKTGYKLKKENENKLQNNVTEKKENNIQLEQETETNEKPKIPSISVQIPSINMDNLSTISISNFQSPSIRNTYSTGAIISPRTQSAIMNICTGNNNENISDWEDDGITIEDIDIAFDDVVTIQTNGENPNVKDDEFVVGEHQDEEFVVGEHQDEDEYCV